MKKTYGSTPLMLLKPEEQKKAREKYLDIIRACPQRRANLIVDSVYSLKRKNNILA